MKYSNRKHLLFDLTVVGLASILLLMLGWRTLLAEKSDTYSQFLPIVASPPPQTELEIWCHAQGENWEPATSTCVVNGQVTFSSPLTVLKVEGISNYGTINNNFDGRYIYNNGTISNDGVINNNNHGTISNDGVIYNNENGTINNYGTISNNDTIRDDGGINIALVNNGTINNYYDHGIIYTFGTTIDNYGTINNDGSINIVFNDGRINNHGTIYNNDTISDTDEDGYIDNFGVISNADDGTIYNAGTIYNGTTYNNGTIDNYGTINNYEDGVIDNRGVINNYCTGIYNGDPPIGNPIVYICDD